jgi:hypothetical protein
MQRRNFLRAVAISGGAGAGLAVVARETVRPKPARESSNVELAVHGFYCPTCAIGLETVLQREAGIARVTAEYPSGRVHIAYDPHKIALPEISRLIEQMGFKVSL